MPFCINNSKDITCDTLFLLDSNNTLSNALDLIAAGGGGSSGITTLNGYGAAVITGSSTVKDITVDLSMYSTSSTMTTFSLCGADRKLRYFAVLRVLTVGVTLLCRISNFPDLKCRHSPAHRHL